MQLAKYIWKLYEKDEKYTIEWKILRQINRRFKPNFVCSLSNIKRLYIANANKRKILNKTNELVTQFLMTQGNIFSLSLITLT